MPGSKKTKGMSMSMSSMGAFLDDLAGIRSKDKNAEKKDTPTPPPPAPPDANTPAGVSSPSTPLPPPSTSTPPIKRRSSWDKSRISITNSLRTLVSPNPKDADVVDRKSLWPGPRLESEDPIDDDGDGDGDGDGDDADKAKADKSAAEAAATAAAAYQAATAASQAAAAAATSAAVQRPKRGKLRAPLSPSTRGTYDTGDDPPPSPGSPLAPRTRRSLSLHSAVSESSQPDTPRLRARGSVDAEGDRTQATGAIPPSVSPSGTPGRQRAGDSSPSPSLPRSGRRGSSQSSMGKAGTMVFDVAPDAGASRGTGSIGSSTSRSPQVGPRPQRRNSGSSGKGAAFGASYGSAGAAPEVEGKEGSTKCFSPEFVGFPSEGGGWRDGSGDAAFARRNSLPNTPSGRRSSNMAAPGPLSRLLAVSTASGSSSISGSGSGRLDGGAVPGKGDHEKTATEGRRGSGEVVAEGAGLFTRRKRTFMEKVGDMLEAAAETAIPAAPSAAAVSRHSSCRRREWDEWDAGPLFEFMGEEARTMANKSRQEEVARTDGDKEQLVILAKAWYIPFLSQGDFNRQKAALERPDVGTVDSSGRCVSVSSARSSSSSAAGARGRVSPPPPPASNSASSSLSGPSPSGRPSSATAEDRGRQGSGSGGGGSTTASAAVSGGSSAVAVGGAVAVQTAAPGGGICRAVVLGYVLDDGAVGAGGRGLSGAAATTADSKRYLVEVELTPGPGAGSKRDERGPWVCYKRYSDFRTLWEGLSRRYTAMEALLKFPPLPTRRGPVFLLGAEGRAAQEKEEEELQQQLSAALEIMLSLNPRPRELVRFLRPHAVGRPAAPATAALDSARRAAAVAGSPGGNLSGVVAVAAAAAGTPVRGRAARGGGLRLDARRKTDARRAAVAAAAAAAASMEGAGQRKEDIESPLPVTPTLRLFLGALAVLQAWASLHAAGLTPGAFAVAAGAVWVLLAGAVIARVQLSKRRSAVAAAAAAPGGCQSGTAAAAGTRDAVVSGADANPPTSPGAAGPAPTEGGGPSAATVVKDGEAAAAAVVAKDPPAVESGDWAVRAVMAGEILALLVLMFLRADNGSRSSSSSGSGSDPFGSGRSLTSPNSIAVAAMSVGNDAADPIRNESHRGNLVVEVAGAVALWAVRAAGVSATALFSVAVPPFLAAMATAHVARTFVVPEKASNTGSDGSSGRPSPDPAAPRRSPPARAAAAVAVGPEAAAAAAAAAKGKPVTTLRRSSSSSSITSEARNRLPPSPAPEGRRSGAIVVSNSNKNANSRNTPTYERSPSPMNDLRGGGGGSGGGMPAIDLSEAALRLSVVGGGVTSVFGGCWVLIRPVAVFSLRRLGMFAAAILTFPFSWAGRHEASGRESNSSGGGGGGSGRSPSPTPVLSSETKKMQKKRHGVRGFRAAVGGDNGGDGIGSNPRPSQTISPAEVIVPKVGVPERSSQVAKAAIPQVGAESATSPEEQYEKASAAVRAFASDAKSAVLKRARRWRASVATKLGPAANRWRASIAKKIMPAGSPDAREGQQDLAPSSDGHGDKPLPSPNSAAPPVLATAAASLQLPRPSFGAALTSSPQPDLARDAAEQLGDAAGLEWKPIRGGWLRGDGEEVQQRQQHLSLGTWAADGDDWLSAVDCAVAAVYASRPQMEEFPCGGGDGGICWRRRGGEGSGVQWLVGADDGTTGNNARLRRVSHSGGGGGGGGGSGGVVFVSTAQVMLLWVVVIFLGVTLRSEYRLARGRRWEALAVLLMAKTFGTAFVIAAFSLLLWEGSGPAWMLCAVEVCRCATLLSLIFAAVQAGIQPEGKVLGDGRSGRTLLRRRTKPRLADDPTTPRGEHLANPAAHAFAWAGRNGGSGGASGSRLADAVPTAPMSESRTRASSGSYSERARRPHPALGGGRAVAAVGGGGTWFSGDSQHSSGDENVSGGEDGVAMATAVAKAKRKHHPSSGSTSSTSNNKGSGGGGSNSNLSRFLSELSTSFHGGGSSGGIRAPRRRKATGQHRTSGRNDRSSSVSAGARTSITAGRGANGARGEGGGGRGTIRPPGLVGEVKPEPWVWGAGDAE